MPKASRSLLISLACAALTPRIMLALSRRGAYYVDRILKGAKPGDLPIEQPTTFETVLNLKTAKLLGLTMTPEIMVRATRVIQ